MNKPIEPGCIAMVRNCKQCPRIKGAIVNVIASVAAPPNKKPGRWWRIESDLVRMLSPDLVATHEDNLQRIDDGDIDPAQELEQETPRNNADAWRPKVQV